MRGISSTPSGFFPFFFSQPRLASDRCTRSAPCPNPLPLSGLPFRKRLPARPLVVDKEFPSVVGMLVWMQIARLQSLGCEDGWMVNACPEQKVWLDRVGWPGLHF